MKQWKYITGSEKDFEGAPNWAVCVCQGSEVLCFYDQITGRGRWKNKGIRGEGYDDIGGLPVIAQRELIEVWNGEGLPPVGTVCQWLASGDHDWINVTVLGHDGEDTWLKPDDGTQSFVVSCAEDFRPLSIERDLAIKEILQIIDHNGVDPLNSAKQIYDTGYRKYSAKPGFEWRYVCSTCGCKVEPGEELPHGC
jgi:hypothetical protein